MDANQAKSYILKLFVHVLHDDNPAEFIVIEWVSRLVECGDPIAIFDSFLAMPSCIAELDAHKDGKSPWPLGHFYSPLTSRKEIRTQESRLYSVAKKLNAISLNIDRQLALLESLKPFIDIFPFPDKKTDEFHYHTDTDSYGYGDGVVL
jgi:hypothetical protein